MKYDRHSVTQSSERKMQHHHTLLLDVWREACRHIEIGEFTETIASFLLPQMPVDQIFVRRLDWQRSCVETLAVWRGSQASPLPDARVELTPDTCEMLRSWCREGRVTRDRSVRTPGGLHATVVPAGIQGEVLAGPLGNAENPSGVLLLTAAPGETFADDHLCLVQLLLEPFSVALENDYRLREITTLREAAEADKRSLLNRLGRKALGDTVVGADSGLRSVMERVELVARSDVPVLINGETGTGKELVARLIHNHSSRHAGPFIRVNCGAIPSELVDSHLFGHEKGAFTGAIETRQGWFERANGGTLLLDELGELPLPAQVRLLRVLQDGWLERVGGTRPINVDVRIVAATHRDLAAMVPEGKFREDLWYRIAVFPIALPTLRERTEDIASLAAHFAERAATRFGLSLVLPTSEEITLLSSYSWPGNIRELAAVIDRAAILGNGVRLEVAKALGVTTMPPARVEPAPVLPNRPVRPAEFLALDCVVKQHVEAVLAATRGRIEGPYGAARILEINPHTLRARMRKLKIDWKQFRKDANRDAPR